MINDIVLCFSLGKKKPIRYIYINIGMSCGLWLVK